jgi:hypothetical protein
MLLAPAAHAAGVLPADATPVQREQAQARFMRARDLMAKKKFDEALVELHASQEIVASPNTRLQIARCLVLSGKKVEAYVELGRTAIEAKELLQQDNRYQRAYDAATAERTELEPQLGFVSLKIDNPAEGTTVTVGEEPLQRAAWSEPAPLSAGTTPIIVKTPGHAPVERSVTVQPGQKVSLTIDAASGAPDAAAPAHPEGAEGAPPAGSSNLKPMRIGAYAAGGVGVLGLATFGIFGAMANSTYNDLKGACGGGPCPSSKAGEISSGKTQETVANVGLVLGVLGVGAGVTLFVLSMPKGAPVQSTGLVVSPGWAGLKGSW